MLTRSSLSQWYELINDHDTKRLVLTGDYTLTVQKSGYNDSIQTVTVGSGTWQHIEVSMEQ